MHGHRLGRSRNRRGVRSLGVWAGLGPIAVSVAVGLVAVGVVVLPSQVAGAATTWTVTNCNDSGPGSLRQLVSGALSFDTVTFASPLSSCPGNVITLTSGPISLPTGSLITLTIAGPGAGLLAVSGGGNSSVFSIPPLAVATISGLTIENGMSNFGGGIASEGTVTVLNCNLMNNSASIGGGGIYNSTNPQGSLSVIGTTLSNNTSPTGYGGALYVDGGALTVTNSTVSNNTALYGGGIMHLESLDANYQAVPATISASTVSNNHATYPIGAGGGINTAGTLNITNSVVSSNTSADFGGGIANYGSTSPTPNGFLTVTNSHLDNNTAPFGGGIYQSGGALNLSGSEMSGNVAKFVSNSGLVGGQGGAIDTVDGFLGTVTASTITNNTSTAGGGIYNDRTGSGLTFKALTLTDSTVANNRAVGGVGQGGGIYNYNYLQLTASTVANNNADSSGGGVYDNYGGTFLSGTIVANNHTTPAVAPNCNGLIGSTIDFGYNLTGDASCTLVYNGYPGSQIGVDPELGPLQDNGGPTQTEALAATSPASTK